MQRFGKGAAMAGGSVVLAYLFFRAAADAFGYVGIALHLLPAGAQAFVASPEGTLFLLAVGVGVIWWGVRHPKEAPDVSSLHEAHTRLQNATAKQRDEISRLTEQVEVLTVERPRVITADQSREIATRLKAWSGYSDMPHMRRVLVMASPKGHDAKTYASQIRLATEHGNIWSEEVSDFTHGDDTHGDGGEQEEVNRGFLKAHDANVTIWGSDTTEHAGEPLDQALLNAFSAAGVDAMHHPGPCSISGVVTVIVGRGVVTQSTRQQAEIARLSDEIETLRAASLQRSLTDEQRSIIAEVVRKGLRDLWESIRASPSWTADEKETPIFVQLYTIEDERETSDYCADFEGAFQDGGLSVALGELTGTQGYRDNEQYVGVVSMLRGNPKNVVRPFILEALRSAGIPVNECDDLPRSMTRRDYGPGGESLGATLIIGQRR